MTLKQSLGTVCGGLLDLGVEGSATQYVCPWVMAESRRCQQQWQGLGLCVFKFCEKEPVNCEEHGFGSCNSLPSGTCFRQQAGFVLAMMPVWLTL